MQIKADIPPQLRDFAESCAGPWKDRYDTILEEAFRRYAILLNAYQLRTIAGGGGGATAQESVKRFELKLHSLLTTKLQFDQAIPVALRERLSGLADELWTLAQQESSLRWTTERGQLEQEVQSWKASVEQARSAHEKDIELATQREAGLQKLLDELQEKHAALQMNHTGLNVRLADAVALADKRGAELHDTAIKLEETSRQLAQQRESFAQERHDVRREHMLELDKVRTQAKEDVQEARRELAELRKERDDLAALSTRSQIEKSQADQRASGLQRDLEQLRTAQAAQANAAELQQKLADDLRHKLAETEAQLAATNRERDRLAEQASVLAELSAHLKAASGKPGKAGQAPGDLIKPTR